MYPYISIYNEIKIPTYGLCFIIGFLLAVIIAVRGAKRRCGSIFVGGENFNASEMASFASDVLHAALYGLIGIGIGAKAFYFFSKVPRILLNFDTYIRLWKLDKLAALDYAFGGLVFYGGLIGAVLGALIYCMQYKVPFWPIARIYTPLIPFVHGFGRIGCFLAGCCYGKEYYGPLCVNYPYNEIAPRLCEVPRFPVQLLEAGMNFFCAIVLFILARRNCDNEIEDCGQSTLGARANASYDDKTNDFEVKCSQVSAQRLLGFYLLYYSVARFFLEFLRGDLERGQYGFISTSQIISLILLPVGIWLIIKRDE